MRQIYLWNVCRRKVWNTYSESRANPTAHDLARVKIGGKGFGIEATHSEKSRDAVDLGLAEIPDIRERNG